MLKSVGINFDNGDMINVEGGATIESKLLTRLDEFDGLHELGYHRLSKGFQYKSHRHKGWIVACILKGRMEVKTVGHEEPEVFGPGDTYFVEPGMVHTETALEDTLALVVMNSADPGSENYAVAGYPAHTIEVPD